MSTYYITVTGEDETGTFFDEYWIRSVDYEDIRHALSERTIYA